MTELSPSPVPAAPDAVSTELATIRHAMRDQHSGYWRGPKGPSGDTLMAERFRQLTEIRMADPGAAAPPPAVQGREKRIAEIRALMRDDHSEYWKGPKDANGQTVLQAEFMRLVDPAAQATPRPDEAAGHADAILAAIPSDTRNAFEFSATILPPTVRQAIKSELTTRGGTPADRFWRIHDTLSPVDARRFEDFINERTEAEWTAIVRHFEGLA